MSKTQTILTYIVFPLLTILIIFLMVDQVVTGHEQIIVKEIIVEHRGTSHDPGYYRVISQDGQLFQVRNSMIRWKFDKEDIRRSINKGDICDIKTQGFGLQYDKNILEAECISGGTK